MDTKCIFLDAEFWDDFQNTCYAGKISMRSFLNEAVRIAINDPEFFDLVKLSFVDYKEKKLKDLIEHVRSDEKANPNRRPPKL